MELYVGDEAVDLVRAPLQSAEGMVHCQGRSDGVADQVNRCRSSGSAFRLGNGELNGSGHVLPRGLQEASRYCPMSGQSEANHFTATLTQCQS